MVSIRCYSGLADSLPANTITNTLEQWLHCKAVKADSLKLLFLGLERQDLHTGNKRGILPDCARALLAEQYLDGDEDSRTNMQLLFTCATRLSSVNRLDLP